jgi:hypothetical protein
MLRLAALLLTAMISGAHAAAQVVLYDSNESGGLKESDFRIYAGTPGEEFVFADGSIEIRPFCSLRMYLGRNGEQWRGPLDVEVHYVTRPADPFSMAAVETRFISTDYRNQHDSRVALLAEFEDARLTVDSYWSPAGSLPCGTTPIAAREQQFVLRLAETPPGAPVRQAAGAADIDGTPDALGCALDNFPDGIAPSDPDTEQKYLDLWFYCMAAPMRIDRIRVAGVDLETDAEATSWSAIKAVFR